MNIPKKIGAAADLLYKLRAKRLELEKKVKAMKADETALKDHFINTLPKDDQRGVTGQIARVKLITKDKASVKDWPKLYKYIKKTGDFAILNRSVSNAHAKALWEDGQKIPGVDKFSKKDLSITKA